MMSKVFVKYLNQQQGEDTMRNWRRGKINDFLSQHKSLSSLDCTLRYKTSNFFIPPSAISNVKNGKIKIFKVKRFRKKKL
jgi:hypothetical protein